MSLTSACDDDGADRTGILEGNDAGIGAAGAPLFQVAISPPEGSSCCANGSCGSKMKYMPKYPSLFMAKVQDDWLVDSFRSALVDGSDDALRNILRTEVPGRVYSFDMLAPAFCAMLLEELEQYEASGMPVARPNSMNNYGLIVNQIGMKPLLDELQKRCLLPLSRVLFPKQSDFTSHHSFMVKYRHGEDLGLDMHHDDSDVTLNVCLGKMFEGATLSFCGYFGDPDHRKHVHTYTHRLGRAVLHLGTHRHGADNILSGERFSLIMWSTGKYRETDEYKSVHGRNLHGADQGDLDPICLSYTHDPDYGEHKGYPEGVAAKPGSRNMHVARFTSSEAAKKAVDLKNKGADDVKEGSWKAAACKYSCAADYAISAATMCPADLLSVVRLNEAHCRLKLGEAQAAEQLCTSTIARDSGNVKALYRRALANISLHEYGAAKADLLVAAKIEPSNKAVRTKLRECGEAANREKANERRLYAAMLGGEGAGKAVEPTAQGEV